METPDRLTSIYQTRFGSKKAYRGAVWRVLIDRWFSSWLCPKDVVLDLGCGFGEFINQITAAKKYGMDLNPATRHLLADDVEFIEQDCSAPWSIQCNSLDVIFTSNFFEHLPDKSCLGRCLEQAFLALKPGGCIIALGPNIAVVKGRYWHFWDHYLPLTDLSLVEGLKLKGYEIEVSLSRTLPYTMVGASEYPIWVLALYLRLPFLWRLLGEQFMVVARKPQIK
ncbi:class I SAM-dependent methyltransferase [Prosthecobacter sp.]|uniref:class I SAM-dependent methyltransferase n=1 Tax=Prosthecobacter sp. TaxID=1965333 RepID=UPI003783158D